MALYRSKSFFLPLSYPSLQSLNVITACGKRENDGV
ncbi:uncharacterized protein G2W53_019516 [Senna tora]|uniref:Uncharacterized protein n=1 Tax=Senna tora TaxID=362788 RepID=A0A834WME5_9FABA|nr:uncharacterized protein G2W53_019516 [Senna tora]